MLGLIKALAVSLIAGRTVGGAFSLLLLVLAPVAAVLKFIGLPILLVVGILGAPIFLLLGALGLPAMLIVGIGGSIMVVLGLILMVGLTILKVALPIILIVWFVRWIFRKTKEPAPVVSAEG